MAGLKVQRADLIPLVSACLKQGQDILEGSLVLMDAGKVIGATNEFILGAQEVGKAKLLRDAFDSGQPEPELVGLKDHEPSTVREASTFASDLEGLTVETFEDLDISGNSAANRPAYQRLLARLGPDVKYVVAYDLSRLTRDGGDLDDLLRATRDHGVLIVDSMNGAITHPDRPRDKMVARMQGVFNQNYLEELSEKVSDALAMKVERGETVGPPPLGYRRNREVLPNGKIARVWTEPDPDVAPIVQLIFREYASGPYSLKSPAGSSTQTRSRSLFAPTSSQDAAHASATPLSGRTCGLLTRSRTSSTTVDTSGRSPATTAPSMTPTSLDCGKARASSTRRPGQPASVGGLRGSAFVSVERGASRPTCSQACSSAHDATRA